MSEQIDFPSRYEQLVGICRGLIWASRAGEHVQRQTFEKRIEDKLVEWEEIDRRQ